MYMYSVTHHPLIAVLEALGLVLSCQLSPLEAPLPHGPGLQQETEPYHCQKTLHKIQYMYVYNVCVYTVLF